MTELSDAFTADLAVDESLGSKEQTATWEHEDLAQVRIRVYRGHTDGVTSGHYMNNDSRILTSSSDKTIKVWKTDTGQILRTYLGGHSAAISKADVSPDEQRFVTSGWDKKVNVWDLESGNILWTGQHAGVVTCCKFSHDGSMMISGSDLDNTLKVWDTNTGELIHNVDNIHTSTITSCIFAPLDDKIITTSMDKTTKFFDLRTSKVTIKLEGHINIISNCDISFDERKFATSSWDKTVKIWDIATGAYRSKGATSLTGSHEGSVSSCKFSSDGLMLVSGSYDATVVVWDVDNAVQKLKLQCSNCGKPFSMTQLESFRDNTICVFCRLQNREKTMLDIMNLSET
ncbi:hypothetical protein KUTeg_019765 [Tegillarca granosa]|uniref:Uncharacterized protein n=1 Tax=Tegillarca granosa TaxID=220873 RepID=A0ABQ9EDJ8_TEGGR|nr:hypothetical protein KUTeg_019765 [Tegillarca granosa]